MNELHFSVWQLPPELKLLLDLAVSRETAQDVDVLDWDRFEALSAQHRVQPLMIRGLRRMGEHGPRHPVLDRYRGMQNKYTMQSMNRLKALAAVNAAFADAGIRLISMKGPLLSMELYGDPSMRTSRDLDLMVAQEDLPRAGEILRQMGYELEQNPYATTPLRHKFYQLIEHEKHEVYNKGELCLELHWQSDYQRSQSFDELWANREERMLLGRSIAVMGTAERYPALVVHAAEHGFLRLRWLLDLYELQKKPGFSWEQVHRTMTAQGIGEILLETILVMYRLDLPDLPELAWEGISLTRGQDGFTVRFGQELSQQMEKARDLSDAVYPLLLRQVRPTEPEWKTYDKLLPSTIYGKTPLQWVLLVLGPTRFEFELIDLPDWLFWLYFLIRPVHWVWRKLFGGRK